MSKYAFICNNWLFVAGADNYNEFVEFTQDEMALGRLIELPQEFASGILPFLPTLHANIFKCRLKTEEEINTYCTDNDIAVLHYNRAISKQTTMVGEYQDMLATQNNTIREDLEQAEDIIIDLLHKAYVKHLIDKGVVITPDNIHDYDVIFENKHRAKTVGELAGITLINDPYINWSEREQNIRTSIYYQEQNAIARGKEFRNEYERGVFDMTFEQVDVSRLFIQDVSVTIDDGIVSANVFAQKRNMQYTPDQLKLYNNEQDKSTSTKAPTNVT